MQSQKYNNISHPSAIFEGDDGSGSGLYRNISGSSSNLFH